MVLGVLGVLLFVGWLVARERLIPRRPARPEETLAGHTVALLGLGLIALLVVATNPFSLVYLLPSLYAWLWLPQAHASGQLARGALLVLGFAGPLMLLLSFSTRLGLGLETPWYLLSLVSVGYVPWIVVALAFAWLAVAAQLTALAVGRYAPYTSAPAPRGPAGRSRLLAGAKRREARRDGGLMRRLARIVGTLMIVAGVGALAWALTVWQWQDPFTAALNKLEQRELAAGLRASGSRRGRAGRSSSTPRVEQLRESLPRAAAAWRKRSQRGDAVARLRIPALGVGEIVVNGTDTGSLKRGPGRYLGSGMPGEGKLVYIAGHRTTYGAPFSRIDRPATRATASSSSCPTRRSSTRSPAAGSCRPSQLSVLKSKGFEQLVLQACHPRFFASHRYLAYAKPVRVTPRGSERGDAVRGARLGYARRR